MAECLAFARSDGDGVLFSYHIFRGGFQSDYVGFWMDYSKFEIGLSERRTT